jgi:ABC-type antimicrobial peptide transport system permease subunit
VLALLLAVLGVYGVMAQAVGERRREFGVRLALGAAPADLLRLVLRQSARLALFGVAVGLLLAIALGLGMASLLFGVRPLDPVAWGAAGGALVIASLLAALASGPPRRRPRAGDRAARGLARR